MKKSYNIPKVTKIVKSSKFRKERVVTHAVDIGEAIRTNTLGSVESSLLRKGMAEDATTCPEFIENFGYIEDEVVDPKKEEDDKK